MVRLFDHDVDDDPVFEPSYDPFLEQDQIPWEREWRETYRFEPEGLEQ